MHTAVLLYSVHLGQRQRRRAGAWRQRRSARDDVVRNLEDVFKTLARDNFVIHSGLYTNTSDKSVQMPEIDFASYFVERLKQCGVKAVFGVPGDYNLEL